MYNSVAISDSDFRVPCSRKVGKGGVCLLWHKRFDNFVSPIFLDDDRILGIQIMLSQTNIVFIFQVYLPCTNHSLSVYKEYIEFLDNIINTYRQMGTVIIMVLSYT